MIETTKQRVGLLGKILLSLGLVSTLLPAARAEEEFHPSPKLKKLCEGRLSQIAFPIRSYAVVENAKGEVKYKPITQGTAFLQGVDGNDFYFRTAQHIVRAPITDVSEENYYFVTDSHSLLDVEASSPLESLLAPGERLLHEEPFFSLYNGPNDKSLFDDPQVEVVDLAHNHDSALLRYRLKMGDYKDLLWSYFAANGLLPGQAMHSSPRLPRNEFLPVLQPPRGDRWKPQIEHSFSDPEHLQQRYAGPIERKAIKETRRTKNATPQEGDEACIVGWRGGRFTVKYGRVIEVSSTEQHIHVIYLDASPGEGMSGGPVFGISSEGKPVQYGMYVGRRKNGEGSRAAVLPSYLGSEMFMLQQREPQKARERVAKIFDHGYKSINAYTRPTVKRNFRNQRR